MEDKRQQETLDPKYHCIQENLSTTEEDDSEEIQIPEDAFDFPQTDFEVQFCDMIISNRPGAEIREFLKENTVYFSDMSWKIICFRLGLDGESPHSREETAEILNVTCKRIIMTEKRLLRPIIHRRRRKSEVL